MEGEVQENAWFSFSGEMRKLFFTKLSFEEFEISLSSRPIVALGSFSCSEKQLSSEVLEEFSGTKITFLKGFCRIFKYSS